MIDDTNDASSQENAEIRKLRRRVAELEAMRGSQRHSPTAVSTEQYFNIFMNHNPAAAWIKDAHGRYVYTNKAHRELLGYDLESIIGMTDSAIFDPELVEHLRANDQRVLDSNEVLQTIESGSAVSSDDVRSWLVNKFPLTDETGQRLVGGMGLDITNQVRAESSLREALDLQRILMAELDHRVRNNLASLVTLINLTRDRSQTVGEFASSIQARVQAMSAVHSLLSHARWQAISVGELVSRMIPHDMHERVEISGADVKVLSNQAMALGMVVQELVSNSLKYGALTHARGNVSVSWSAEETDSQWLVELHWNERGGATIDEPGNNVGVGTNLIRGLVRSDLQGSVNLAYPPEGAAHQFSLRLMKAEQ